MTGIHAYIHMHTLKVILMPARMHAFRHCNMHLYLYRIIHAYIYLQIYKPACIHDRKYTHLNTSTRRYACACIYAQSKHTYTHRPTCIDTIQSYMNDYNFSSLKYEAPDSWTLEGLIFRCRITYWLNVLHQNAVPVGQVSLANLLTSSLIKYGNAWQRYM